MKHLLIILSILFLASSAFAFGEETDEDYKDDQISEYQPYQPFGESTPAQQEEDEEFLPHGFHREGPESYSTTFDEERIRDPETSREYDQDDRLPSGKRWEPAGDFPSQGIRVH